MFPENGSCVLGDRLRVVFHTKKIKMVTLTVKKSLMLKHKGRLGVMVIIKRVYTEGTVIMKLAVGN